MRWLHTILAILVFLLGLATAGCAINEDVEVEVESSKETVEASAAAEKIGPGLEVYRALAGDWLVVGADGKPTSTVGLSYRVTAGGSAVAETVFPGQSHEMLTVYVEDEKGLLLTHYCVLGNQPSMRLQKGSTSTHLIWDLCCCGNLKSDKDQHMHSAVVDLVDADHISSTWHMFAGGKKVDANSMKLVRRKSD